MPTRISVVYDNPLDPSEFEHGFAKQQLALAHAMPGVLKVESAKVWPKEDGTPPPAYRLLDLYFADYDAASAAVDTPAAAALFPDIIDLATGGVRIIFADVEES